MDKNKIKRFLFLGMASVGVAVAGLAGAQYVGTSTDVMANATSTAPAASSVPPYVIAPVIIVAPTSSLASKAATTGLVYLTLQTIVQEIQSILNQGSIQSSTFVSSGEAGEVLTAITGLQNVISRL